MCTHSPTEAPPSSLQPKESAADPRCEQGHPVVLNDWEKVKGTVAYAAQSGEQPDCSAAVESWKAAYEKFETMPPAYTRDHKAPYNDIDSISFVALFTPKENPTASCAFYTCAATRPKPSSKSPPSENQQNSQDEEAPLRVLLCLTAPRALEHGKEPYS